MSETEEAMGATVGRCKVDSMSLSGCAWVERISLQCLPHRNIYSTALEKKKASSVSAVDDFSSHVDILFYRLI